MVGLSYPNPSLSDIAEEHRRSRSRSVTMTTDDEEPWRHIPEPPPGGAPEPQKKMTARQILLTIIILLGLMFSCLDISIISTALLSIGNDFGGQQDATWPVLSYLLTYMGFAVGFSKLSDLYGRKHLLATAWLFFAGFSIWCALATEMNHLIIARALQGIGGSGLYSLAQVCLLEQGPSRPEIQGAMVGATLSISYILGPLLGGGISASAWTWRGIFWLNVPFGALALVGIYTLWPPQHRQKYNRWTTIFKIDLVGNILLIVATILLVFALQEAGSFEWSWSSPVIIWSLCVSAISWILLIIWESYLFYGPMQQIQAIFPIRLASNRVYLSTIIVTLLTGYVYISLVVKIPETFQLVYHDTPMWAGVHLLPMLGSCAFGSFLGGALSKRKNITCPTLIVGNLLQTLALSLICGLTKMNSGIQLLMGISAIYGLGIGLCLAACTMISVIEARQGDIATAQGSVAQARVFGGAIGLAVCTIIWNQLVHYKLGPGSGAGFEKEVLGQIHRGVVSYQEYTGPQRVLVLGTAIEAFKRQVLMMLIVTSVALVVSFGTYRSKPADVVDVMVQHKEFAGRTSDSATELESVGSVRSLVR